MTTRFNKWFKASFDNLAATERREFSKSLLALADIIGEKTGELEKRIIALESENKQLRTDLEILRSSNVKVIRNVA